MEKIFIIPLRFYTTEPMIVFQILNMPLILCAQASHYVI